MKRAKIMLSAIAIFAIVGGALAFKANRNVVVFYTGTAGKCTVLTAGTTTLTAPIINVSTTPLTTGCPTARFTDAQG
ncbi:hypothetical protein [Chitinophaga sp. YR573]|uniref:hypothetical protein n=1 Tax=Chitinophaga sp. YR573 TaxID=1881040 RepID=UPI000B7F70D4|nr:hypothetical protein [Chitinophaga sp. YR573]